MRYKIKLDPNVKNAVEWHLSAYPANKRSLENLQKNNEIQRRRIVNPLYVRALEDNVNAIERALINVDDSDLELIDLIFWQRKGIADAATALFMCDTSIRMKLHSIECIMAYEMGYLNAL